MEAVEALLHSPGRAAHLPPPAALTPLLVTAAAAGQVGSVRALLDAGADVDAPAEVFTPLLAAASAGQEGVARLLLERGASPDLAVEGASTPLYLASALGHEGVVEALLAWAQAGHAVGVDVGWEGAGGDSPLIAAARNVGGEQVVRRLLEAGASVGYRNQEGVNAMEAARSAGAVQVAELLAGRGGGAIGE